MNRTSTVRQLLTPRHGLVGSWYLGNDEDKAELEQRLNSLDKATYWFENDKDINAIARCKRSEILPVELYNPLEGYENARSLNEPIADFLERVPVATTDMTHDGWIWCANPFTNKRDEHQDTATLVQKGSIALSAYQDKASQIQSGGRNGSQAAVTRQLNEERAALKSDLENLARQCGVLSGKVCHALHFARYDADISKVDAVPRPRNTGAHLAYCLRWDGAE